MVVQCCCESGKIIIIFGTCAAIMCSLKISQLSKAQAHSYNVHMTTLTILVLDLIYINAQPNCLASSLDRLKKTTHISGRQIF